MVAQIPLTRSPIKMTLEEMMKRMSGDVASELNLVLKTDVQGSLEACRGALMQLGTDHEIAEVGTFSPHPTTVKELRAGEVGYFVSNIKQQSAV